jgi:hypothetical protein
MAAEQGHAGALLALGKCYRKGVGDLVDKDDVESYAYYSLASLTPDEKSIEILNLIITIMSQEDILKGQKRTNEIRRDIVVNFDLNWDSVDMFRYRAFQSVAKRYG